MSEENVEIVRRAFDAFRHDGIDGVMPHLHPEIEWTTMANGVVERGTFRGHDGVRRSTGKLAESFESFHSEPDELIDAGEQAPCGALRFGRPALPR